MAHLTSPFSAADLRQALRRCAESAVGADGLPYSLFKVEFPWWQTALLRLYNLALSCGTIPSLWKHSIVIPVFKQGDPTVAGNFRPISLASCCFKVLEHLIHDRIVSHVSQQLHNSQGGYRWGADLVAGSFIDVLNARSTIHTFVAFIDIQKAFDTSWVEATLLRLHEVGVTGRMWSLISACVHHTWSQVRVGAELSDPWQDVGIAQGRVLSPLLFNLLVDGLACAVHDAAPGVSLAPHPDFRFTQQLHADDLVLAAECESDLQAALDAVAAWGFKFRFTFGVGPTKPL